MIILTMLRAIRSTWIEALALRREMLKRYPHLSDE